MAGSWTPDAYYRASRAARQAWQARDQQLTLVGLEDAQPSALRILEPAPASPFSPAGAGSKQGATEPRCAPSIDVPDGRPADGTATPPLGSGGVSVAPYSHVGPHRTEQEPVRGGGQEVNPTMLQRILHPGVRTW